MYILLAHAKICPSYTYAQIVYMWWNLRHNTVEEEVEVGLEAIYMLI